VVAFSEKDAQMARRIQPTANVVVVNPPLIDPEMPTSFPGIVSPRKTVLFTGALSRSENHEAVMWFLEKIWPGVTAAVPDARFTIAGSGPRADLLDRARALENVTVTGFVKDLNKYYRTAGLFVAPLRRGAGVKFKTITAMLWGLPIVTTDIGAEGIGEKRLFVAVTNDPAEFLEAIVKSLRGPQSNSTIVRESFDWAHSHYSLKAFRRSLEVISKGGELHNSAGAIADLSV
jgi:glycosyltransferase involved in cell wall biosynthesis